MEEPITFFEDTPLTNFYVGEPIVIEFGIPWTGSFLTGEHAFQAQKASNQKHAELVMVQRTASFAKSRGRGIDLRPDWEDIKVGCMKVILNAKFTLDRYEGEYLLSTGDRELIEGTWWNDRIWGVDLNTPGHPGENLLGKLLMARREELKIERT